MQNMYYIGLDVHNRKISYCVKDSSGEIYAEGSLPASPEARQKLAHCACPERGRRVSGGIKFPHQKSPSPGGAADSSAPERISWEQQSAISEQEARRGYAKSQGLRRTRAPPDWREKRNWKIENGERETRSGNLKTLVQKTQPWGTRKDWLLELTL